MFQFASEIKKAKYKVCVAYDKAWVGGDSTGDIKRTRVFEAVSFSDAQDQAMQKYKYPSGHFNVRVLSIELIEQQ